MSTQIQQDDPRFGVAAITRFSEVIRQFIEAYPEPLTFDPTPLAVDTFAARLRDAIRGQQHARFSVLDEATTNKLVQIGNTFTVSKQPPYVVIGRADLVAAFTRKNRPPRKSQTNILKPQPISDPNFREPLITFQPHLKDFELAFAYLVLLQRDIVDFVAFNNPQSEVQQLITHAKGQITTFSNIENIQIIPDDDDASCIVVKQEAATFAPPIEPSDAEPRRELPGSDTIL